MDQMGFFQEEVISLDQYFTKKGEGGGSGSAANEDHGSVFRLRELKHPGVPGLLSPHRGPDYLENGIV